MTSRFAEVVAGPGVEQKARLIVDYFPGDGEAITSLQVRAPSAEARILRAVSRLGRVSLEESGFHIDYSEDGIGRRLADTVDVYLLTPPEPMAFDLSLATNVATPAVAHQTTATLVTIQPLRASLSMEPAQVYPGESVELRLSVDRAEDEDREIESIHAEWPQEVTPVGDPVTTGEGSSLEMRQAVRVRRNVAGPLALVVSAADAQLLASPIVTPDLIIAAMPTFRVDVPGDRIRRGEVSRLRLHWHNETAQTIVASSLMAQAVAGFSRARLVPTEGAETGGVRLEADEEKGSVVVRVSSERELAPGEDFVVAVDVTPLSSGPFTIVGRFLPTDRSTPVSLGNGIVQVIAPEAELAPPVTGTETDLELARRGLEAELRQALVALPLARGAALQLSSSRTDDGNWVVEGLLTDLLLERGVRVMADSAAGDVLHYRLADARVVYSPSGSSWNLLDDSERRDARMEVFLRLEDAAGRVLWVDRVASSNGENKASADASWLGGAKGIDQVSVTPDHRAIEIGLSGLIVGGLFFVFFVP